MKKLNIDNPFFEFMGRLGDMILLNLIFIATCIPVVTIGAAQTAMYQVMLRRVRKESNYAVREYLASFRREWRQSTKLWLIFLVTGVILVFDILYIGKEWRLLGVGVGCLLFLWVMLESYVFPIQAQFDNTWKNTLKNAGYMAVRHFPYTLAVMALNLLPVFCFFADSVITEMTVPVFMAAAFALIARANAAMFSRIFSHYIEEKQIDDYRTEEEKGVWEK